jgi:hypothetical protein
MASDIPSLLSMIPPNHVMLGENHTLRRGTTLVRLSGGHLLIQEWGWNERARVWLKRDHGVELFKDEAIKLKFELTRPRPKRAKVKEKPCQT